MNTIFTYILLFFSATLIAQSELDTLLNNWHKAAEEADFKLYFSYFSEDARFIGTDASENWTIPEFKSYAKASFQEAPAWKFTPVQRNLEISKEGNLAWFDELLTSSHLGICRGSGVLVLENESWKIQHYVLSMIIPNELARDVAKQKQKADAESMLQIRKE